MFFSHASLQQIFFDMLGLAKPLIWQSDHLLSVHSNSTLSCLAFLQIPKSITPGTGSRGPECSSLAQQHSNFSTDPVTPTLTLTFMWNTATANLLHCGWSPLVIASGRGRHTKVIRWT